jgi:hypothetical protein
MSLQYTRILFHPRTLRLLLSPFLFQLGERTLFRHCTFACYIAGEYLAIHEGIRTQE